MDHWQTEKEEQKNAFLRGTIMMGILNYNHRTFTTLKRLKTAHHETKKNKKKLWKWLVEFHVFDFSFMTLTSFSPCRVSLGNSQSPRSGQQNCTPDNEPSQAHTANETSKFKVLALSSRLISCIITKHCIPNAILE